MFSTTMFNTKSFLIAVAISMLQVSVRPVFAASQDKAETQWVAKVKSDVARRGVGEKAHVKVKLRDKTEVKGYISQAGEDDFVVADSKTNAKTTIAYRDVSKVEGKGLSLGVKIGIGVAILVVVVVVVAVAASNSLDNAFHSGPILH